MSLRPLGNRLIIRPEPAETVSAGGIFFPDTAGTPPAMSGTVVSVGRGPATAHRVRDATLAHVLGLIEKVAHAVPSSCLASALTTRITAYAMEDVTFAEVVEGDYVAFSFTSGHQMAVDGETLLVLQEDDLQAVWKAEENAA